MCWCSSVTLPYPCCLPQLDVLTQTVTLLEQRLCMVEDRVEMQGAANGVRASRETCVGAFAPGNGALATWARIA